MTLKDFRTAFLSVSIIGVFIASSPVLVLTLPKVGSEKFSELYVLGSDRMAENYPFNVMENGSYLIHVGIANHMGSSEYYAVFVKFRNQSEALPDVTSGIPSPLEPLYEYRVLLEDGEVLEVPLKFSFLGVSFSWNQALVESLTINDVLFSVKKSSFWDEEDKGYYYQLFIELWVYNLDAGGFQYHNRFVSLWLNMTRNI